MKKISDKLIIRFLIFSPFVLLLSIFLISASLNYSGFCFKEMRYLTNEEKIRFVFDYQNSRDTMPIDTVNKETQYYKQIKYKSFEEFIRSHPNCCQVNPGGGYDLPPPEFLDRITGYNSGDVIVLNFEVRYLDENNNGQSRKFKFENALQNCGEIKW